MQQLYFIRHGLSELNKKGAMAGYVDTPLAKEGHEQAKQAGQKAKQQGLSFDIIVCSPLQRAHHTAKHIAAAVDYPHDNIELNDLFKERGYGVLEGVHQSEIVPEYFEDESAIDPFPQVEPFEAFQERANQALEYLHSLDHHTVLVVSHGGLGRALYRAVNNLPTSERNIRYPNAELIQFL